MWLDERWVTTQKHLIFTTQKKQTKKKIQWKNYTENQHAVSCNLGNNTKCFDYIMR